MSDLVKFVPVSRSGRKASTIPSVRIDKTGLYLNRALADLFCLPDEETIGIDILLDKGNGFHIQRGDTITIRPMAGGIWRGHCKSLMYFLGIPEPTTFRAETKKRRGAIAIVCTFGMEV